MTPCREWQGRRQSCGYGIKRQPSRGRKTVYAHRWVVEQAGVDKYGTPWDPSLKVLHDCDNPPCFRYDHLRLGTVADNTRDMHERGRWNLHPDDVLVIHASDESGPVLAERYGVSRVTISHIKRGKTWSWLTAAQGGQQQ